MTVTFVALWLFAIVLGSTAVVALIWAIGSGQFRNINQGAKVIFDEDEPIGETTDSFPIENKTTWSN